MSHGTSTHIPYVYTQRVPPPIHPGLWSLRKQRLLTPVRGTSHTAAFPLCQEDLECYTQQGSSSHTHSVKPFCNCCANYFTPHRGFVCVLTNVSQLCGLCTLRENHLQLEGWSLGLQGFGFSFTFSGSLFIVKVNDLHTHFTLVFPSVQVVFCPV